MTIPVGAYHWMRYRFEAGFAPKRRLSGQATWWTGGFYTGTLDELQLTGAWKPSPLFIVELNATHNRGRLPQGDFTQNLVGTRLRVNFSPNLQYNSYLQYDNESDAFGANTRVRWTFSPLGDLFIVYNHNLRHDIDPISGRPVDPLLETDPTRRLDRRWGFGPNQLIVKVQCAVRYCRGVPVRVLSRARLAGLHSRVQRPLAFRLIAVITALLGSLAAPAQALAHGHVHEHLAADHGHQASHSDHLEHEDHTTRPHGPASAASAVVDADDAHAHGHAQLLAVQGARDLHRLRLAPEALVLVVPVEAIRLAPAATHPPTRTVHVRLARPEPERGPPPTLRAPPIR